MDTQFKKYRLVDALMIALLCGFTFFYGLGRVPLLGPDEPRYVEVAREMYISGDWITPTLAGGVWFEKPSLLYWMTAAGFTVFGVSEFAARFGVALLSTVGALIAYFFGSRVRSRAFGVASAVSLATMGLWIGFSRAATFDLPLAVIIECFLFSFFLADCEDFKATATKWVLACGVLMGLALLAKGLAGPVIAGLVTCTYLLVTRRLRLAIARPGVLALAALLTVVTAAVWYWPMFTRHGWAFFADFFIAHHLQRYVSDKYHHPQPFYFFFVVALVGTFPWSALVVRSAVESFRNLRSESPAPNRRLDILIWLWVLAPILFFSFSGSKLPGYILPVFPALALAVGSAGEGTRAESSWPFAVTGLLVLLAAVGVSLRVPAELGVSQSSILIVSVTAAIVAVAVAAARYFRGPLAAIVVLSAGVAAIAVVTVIVIYPALGERESLRDLAFTAKAKALPGERLVFYLDNHQGINYYATELPLREERSELLTLKHGDEMAGLLLAKGFETVEVMAYDRWVPGLEENPLISVERLARQGRKIACSPSCDWVLVRVRRR